MDYVILSIPYYYWSRKMSYSYKVGNNGPTLEVDDAIKISQDSFSKGGMFSDDEWKIHYTAPGQTGVLTINKRTSTINSGGYSIKVNW